jgi:hypothetical protein
VDWRSLFWSFPFLAVNSRMPACIEPPGQIERGSNVAVIDAGRAWLGPAVCKANLRVPVSWVGNQTERIESLKHERLPLHELRSMVLVQNDN